jgi:hypothetical protein
MMIRAFTALTLFFSAIELRQVHAQTIHPQVQNQGQVPFCCQFWNLNFIRGQIDQGGKWDYYLELQPRANFDEPERSRILLRPALVYNLDQSQSLWAGALYQTDASLKATEYRTWQQYQRTDQTQKVIFLNRTRLEQRFKEGENDAGLRLRHMIRAQIPAGEESQWSVVLFDELFIGLNENGSQSMRGFDQNRFFGGLRYESANRLFYEIGILNQFTGSEVYNIPMITIGKIIKKKKRSK